MKRKEVDDDYDDDADDDDDDADNDDDDDDDAGDDDDDDIKFCPHCWLVLSPIGVFSLIIDDASFMSTYDYQVIKVINFLLLWGIYIYIHVCYAMSSCVVLCFVLLCCVM